MPFVLFVCTANRYRSPIAAAVFSSKLGQDQQTEDWKVDSAGTWTQNGLPVVPEAAQSAAQKGLNLSTHRSKNITSDLIHQADLILVMENGQKEALEIEFPDCRKKIYLLSQATVGIPFDIPDPMIHPEAGDVSREILEMISFNLDKLKLLAKRKV